MTILRLLRSLLLPAGIAAISATLLPGQNAQLLWSVPWSNAAYVQSRSCTSPASDLEAADDFDVQGTITRVVVNGYGCSSCAAPTVSGATVRFYAWNQGAVGALQHEVFVPATSASLVYSTQTPSNVEITLPQPFVASGRHFVSVQLHFVGSGFWAPWVANWNAPAMSAVQVRDRLGANQWASPTIFPWPSVPVIADLDIRLWGLPAGVSGDPAVPCVTWSPLDVDPVPNATSGRFSDVKVFGVDDVWAVGQSTMPAGSGFDSFTTVAHWDGHEFSIVPSPSPGPAVGLVNCYLDAVDGMSSSDLWVAGTYQVQISGGWGGQQVFAMHWDGATWTVPVDLPLPNTSISGGVSGSNVTDLKAIASDDVWFVGDWIDIQSAANPTLIRPGLLMHFDGASLNQTLLPIVTGVGHQYFNAVGASGTDDVWVVGGAGSPSSTAMSTVPVIFQFDGASWTHRPCPAPPGYVNIHDVEVLGPGDVLVFGTSMITSPTLSVTHFMAHWNGSTWTLLPGVPGAVAVKAFASSLVWAVGASAWLWDGVQWTEQYEIATHAQGSLVAIDGLSPCEAYGVGGAVGQDVPFAARQDNYGAWNTRTRLPTLPTFAPCRLQAQSAVRPGEVVSVGIDDPAGVLSGGRALTFWLIASAAAPAGTGIPFGGVGGGPGEVLVDPATLILATAPVVLGGGGVAVHSLLLPMNAALVGVPLATQGLVLDVGPPGSIVLTNAVDMQIGW